MSRTVTPFCLGLLSLLFFGTCGGGGGDSTCTECAIPNASASCTQATKCADNSADVSAYMYTPATGFYTTVPGTDTPGFNTTIEPGQGFYTRFSNTYYLDRAIQKYLRMALGK